MAEKLTADDRLEIMELFARYAWGIDLADKEMALSAFAEDAIAKSRDAYHKFASLAKDNAKVAEEVLLTTQAGAKSIGEKIVANTFANTEAAFEAAQAMARASSSTARARSSGMGRSMA